jgi:mRNA-degrading endonuclease RelE of RelBE toxin-antitoxin system
MRIAQTPHFKRAVKRLHANQKRDLDEAVKMVAENPAIGDRKAGDLGVPPSESHPGGDG